MSKAEPGELEEFLKTLWQVHTKPDTVNAPGTSLKWLGAANKASINDHMQRKLVVDESRDLPDHYPPNLNTVKILGHDLLSLPNKILGLSKLTNLDLSDNNLSTLPKEFARLNNVASVNLSHNQFKHFSSSLCQSITDDSIAPLFRNGAEGVI